MNFRTWLIILLVGLTAVLLLWQPWDEQPDVISDIGTEQQIPDFTAEGLVTRIYESDGMLTHQIRAEHMAYFGQLRLTELQAPVYISNLRDMPVGAGELWQVKARKGRFINEEKLELIDDVEITNLSEIGYIRNISTDYLAINIVTQEMYTDSAVLITGPQFIVRGIGLRVNLETQQLELIEHVRTTYYPNNLVRESL
ncbi:MAG: LPS export ABC transporter periplasmic protein LptC [Idiomarina sp.]|nr:LPS export ABC transporter periplasmic protein LptC [Idiomarina sp.]